MLVSDVQRGDSVICYQFFSIIAYYRILHVVPCAIQWSWLVVCFIHVTVYLLIPGDAVIWGPKALVPLQWPPGTASLFLSCLTPCSWLSLFLIPSPWTDYFLKMPASGAAQGGPGGGVKAESTSLSGGCTGSEQDHWSLCQQIRPACRPGESQQVPGDRPWCLPLSSQSFTVRDLGTY